MGHRQATVENGGAAARRQDSFGSDTSEQEKVSQSRQPLALALVRSLYTSANASAPQEILHRPATGHWFGEHHRKGTKRRTVSMSSSTKPASPTVNLYTHCGRHSDQFLFGGWTDLIRSRFKKE